MPLIATFTGIGWGPILIGARARSFRTVEIEFSEPVTNNSHLRDPATYLVRPKYDDVGTTEVDVIDVIPNTLVGPTRVTLYLDDDLSVGFENYEVHVDPSFGPVSVIDLAGNPIEIDGRWREFSGLDYNVRNHCELAQSRLLAQFKPRDRIRRYICALSTPPGDLERMFSDMLLYRSLDNAFGVQLDMLGLLYMRTRRGKTDDQYRVMLRADARKVSSRGRPNDLLDILAILDNGFSSPNLRLYEHYPASLILTARLPVGSQALGEEFLSIMKQAKPAGVRIVFLYEFDDTEHFVWSGDVGLGFAEEDDTEGTGGVWAEGI